MKLLKSKLFLGSLCMLLAVVFAFFLLPQIYSEKTMTTYVVQAITDIQEGDVITAEMLETSEIGAYGLSNKIAQTKEDVLGKVATSTIYSGEMIWKDRIVTPEEYQKIQRLQTKGLEEGYSLVTLKLPKSSSGIAGVLRAGNLVDAYECLEDEFMNVTVTKVLSSVYVYNVLNAKLQPLDTLDKIASSAVDTTDLDLDYNPAYVIVRCTDAEALTLLRLEWEESLHLALTNTKG